ncbi:hypothetical protein [Pseudanabaena sp. 'Roaring Creek']|uniref:hypothetical protein n=1 Tax=Pseudanabaena sp. 'Roaring Creek' TaxID=1681830 RepID=UPI0006D7C7AB|nr:hypothetical protein [Pseudanabaena sp. 'Roaring Creek']
MSQLHFFNPTQTTLDLDIPKRGNPNFKNKYLSGTTKPIRIPIAHISKVQTYIKALENNQLFITNQEVQKINIRELVLNPKRFQYKLIHGASGSTGSLREVKQWDDNLAGLILVWLDPDDGKTYVINGHNRVTLALNLGIELLWVKYINASNAIEARAIGALANIADDKGNAIDAGKFFRDMGYSSDNLPKNIDLTKTVCSQGLALARLCDELFMQVVNGDISTAIAVAIGENLPDRDLQLDLWELLKSRKNVKADLVCELCQVVTNAKKSHADNSVTLFDLGSFMASNAIYLAELQAYIKQRLSRDRRLFRTVAKSRNAESLSRANNHIDRDKSAQIADESDYILRLFDELKAYKNSVTQLLNEFADRLGNGENCNDDCYIAVCEYLTSVTLRDLAA